MQPIPESELIINNRGAIYHLDLRPDELADTVITVGDPERVQLVSKFFDSIETTAAHREFVSATGYLAKKRVTVISTGIGTDNIDIVLNELDALVNIDFNTRMIKPELRQLQIIRIGTSGSLQESVPVDSFVMSTHGLGIDNLLNFYRHNNNEEEKELIQAFITQTQLHHSVAHPYISSCSPSLAKHFVSEFYKGITVTCPGFYGPQSRILRLGLSQPQLQQRLTGFSFGMHQISNFEMETSGIYGLGKILGHQCLSLSAIVANRVSKQFSKDGGKTVESLIKKSLDIIAGI
ncbi:MAG: nucleoside phosphorylase [Flavitalea sp.]